MADITQTKKLLDEINAALASYDPALKEYARDILLKEAFGKNSGAPAPKVEIDGTNSPAAKQPHFHTLAEKWTPVTQAEWALLGAYYFQIVLGNDSITALEVNNILKQHGAILANITRSFEEQIAQSPAFMRQIGKSGKSRQAKKRYVLTTNGVQFVDGKLNGRAEV